MYPITAVTDATPGAVSRPPTDADSMLHINDDGTVTIPPAAEVYELGDYLWFRTPRLRGWNAVRRQSPIMVDPSRTVDVAVREELARTGRTVTHWTQTDADAARQRELQYWRGLDASHATRP